jgi:starch phosphorylase
MTVAFDAAREDSTVAEARARRLAEQERLHVGGVSPDGVARYTGSAELGEPGPFGYTVRVLPRHGLLSGPAELGLVTLPGAPAGMVNGDLR